MNNIALNSHGKRFLSDVYLFLIFFFAGLGAFYNSSKFHIPWYGADDFEAYYGMVKHPFANNVGAPFAYRIITPAVASGFWHLGFYYESAKTPYKDFFVNYQSKVYDPSVLPSLIFANFIFLVLALFFISKIIKDIFKSRSEALVNTLSVFVPVMVFLSMSTNVHGLAGMTEGGSIFFITILVYFFRKGYFYLFALFAMLSVFQRELIPIIILVYLLFAEKEQKTHRYFAVLLISILGYFFVKRVCNFPGFEYQTNFSSMINLLLTGDVIKGLFLQTIVFNNVTWFVVLTLVFLKVPLAGFKMLMPYALVCICLYFIGRATGIGNGNVGRILNMPLPLLLIGFCEIVNRYCDGKPKMHSMG